MKEGRDHLSKVGFIIGPHGWGEDSQKKGLLENEISTIFVCICGRLECGRISHCKQSTNL